MRLDKYKNPIYNSKDIFDLLYQGKADYLSSINVDMNDELKSLEHISNITLDTLTIEDISIDAFDKINQQDWFIPAEYKELDIKQWLLDQCQSSYQRDRVVEEFTEFQSRNMVDTLRWLKYFVDTCIEENILWGVGRGSSVASYILFLIGIHHIDPIKFNLDWREFLR